VVGFPAGGGTDVIARILAERLRVPFASSVIVENKPGGAARVSVDYVKNAEPDGSVMLFTPDFPITLYPHSFRSLSYDPLRDLVAVAPAARSMLTYIVGPAVPAGVKSLADFVQWCKAHPESAAYATTAAGGTPHFVGVMLASAAGIAMTPVHYRGGAPALQDLLGGHVPAGVNPISETLSQARSGTLRILAVTGARRSPFLPDVPTIAEQGIEGVVAVGWIGLSAPARTPEPILDRLSAEVMKILKEPEVLEKLKSLAFVPAKESRQEFEAYIAIENTKWRKIVQDAGVKIE